MELLGCLEDLDWCEIKTRSGEKGFVLASGLKLKSSNGTKSVYQSGNSGAIPITNRRAIEHHDRQDGKYPTHNYNTQPEQEKTKPKFPKTEKYNPLCPLGINDC